MRLPSCRPFAKRTNGGSVSLEDWRCYVGVPFEEEAIARSTFFTYPPETPLRTCSAEDLIVMKAFAARAKDWLDVEGIIVRQSGGLDWPYIRRQLEPLAELKEAPELLNELERRRAEFERL